MVELSLAVVGIDYPNSDRSKSNRRFELLQCIPGEPVELRPEPKNEHDPYAIAVYSARGVQIGYLTAERAPWIGAKLKTAGEVTVLFQGLDASAAYIRIRFGGGSPTVPPMGKRERQPVLRDQRADPDAGFWPDDDGPEWGA